MSKPHAMMSLAFSYANLLAAKGGKEVGREGEGWSEKSRERKMMKGVAMRRRRRGPRRVCFACLVESADQGPHTPAQ